MSDEDQEKVKEWLEEKCGVLRCFCCGGASFQLLPGGYVALGFELRTGRFHYSQGTTLVLVGCTNCAHVLPFSAGMIGLRPSPPEAAET